MEPRLFPDEGECSGKLVPFIVDESQWACTVCHWIGWPRQRIDPKSGVILREHRHPYTPFDRAAGKTGA